MSQLDGFFADAARILEVDVDERVVEMHKEAAHQNVDRVELAQRRFLREGNLGLTPPLRWSVYGDDYEILEPAQDADRSAMSRTNR